MTEWQMEAVMDLGGMKEAMNMQLSRIEQAIQQVQQLPDNEHGQAKWKETRDSIISHVVQIGHAYRWCCEHPECQQK